MRASYLHEEPRLADRLSWTAASGESNVASAGLRNDTKMQPERMFSRTRTRHWQIRPSTTALPSLKAEKNGVLTFRTEHLRDHRKLGRRLVPSKCLIWSMPALNTSLA